MAGPRDQIAGTDQGAESDMIEARSLTKKYGNTVAVDGLSFRVEPGVVTGFLGPNGAGKSTTMRMVMGLDRPTAGTAVIGGRAYRDLTNPLREVGALLDAAAVHPGRHAYDHLLALARSNGIARGRVSAVLEQVGLSSVAGRRVGTFSLGMRQRLGIAAALLGDPPVLLFDEPINGLDPEGIAWIRHLMRALAAEGRTVFLSSHLMSEMEDTADRLVVIGSGRLVAETSLAEFIRSGTHAAVQVASPRIAELVNLLDAAGATIASADNHAVMVGGMTAAQIGDIAAEHGIPLHELTPHQARLEEAFMRLTKESAQYVAEAVR
jgi:ABC-2 type transport system ATP-binding protein